jgi:hypothetical protein
MPMWTPETPDAGSEKRDEVAEALEIVRKMSAERAMEMKREAEARDAESVAEARRELEISGEGTQAIGHVTPFREDLYGAFAVERRADGKIALSGEAASAAEKAADEFRRGAKSLNNLVAGEKIAAEYDTRTGNFRAQTRLDTLPDGRKIFMIYDYRGSWVHRTLDGAMKRLNGLPMRKADRGEWKKLHELKTPIPVIENGDPHMAMMPYVPNANAKDVFANNAEIENFGACDWAKDAGLEEKNALSGKIMDEMKRFHDRKGAWGEAVLSNVIFTEKQEPVMCDFEVMYDEDVPSAEAKARDVKDMCTSIGAALEAAHGQDVAVTVKRLLDRYADPEVIAEAKKLASKKRGVLANLFFGYEQARSGAKDKKQYDAVREAIAAYEKG